MGEAALSGFQIVTPYGLDPIHPRTEMIRDFAEASGYRVRIGPRHDSRFGKAFNLPTFGFFDLYRSLAVQRDLGDADVVFVQDLRMLPVVLLARLRHKIVVYETLDRGVVLQFFNLVQRRPWLAWLRFAQPWLERLERLAAQRCSNAIVVNSEALEEYFDGRAHLIYYASALEDVPRSPACERAALLFLGLFSSDKGAWEALRLREELGLPLFIFGDAPEAEVAESISKSSSVTFVPRLDSARLKQSLVDLRSRYRLLGLSLIKDVHLSYSTQEANKDIDYLAMGVPIVGNHRRPTEEKIQAGCGAFSEDVGAVRRLAVDPARFREVSALCETYYRSRYSRSVFEQRMKRLFEDLELERYR